MAGNSIAGAGKDGLPPSQRKIFKAILSLKKNRKYSDLIIKCGEREWHTHKLVLCPQSAFFERACDGGFEEAAEGVLTLQDDMPEAVDAMLDFLYDHDYSHRDYSDRISKAAGLSAIHFHIVMFAIGDKYGIEPLVQLASSRFCDLAGKVWPTSGFAEAIRELYENAPDNDTGREMRRHAVDISFTHAKELLTQSNGAEFRKVVSEVTVFGTEFQIASTEPRDQYLCSHMGYKRLFTLPQGRAGSCPFCKHSAKAGHHTALPREKEGVPWAQPDGDDD